MTLNKELLDKLLLRGINVVLAVSNNQETIEIINMKLDEIYSQEGYYKYLLLLKYFSIKDEIQNFEKVLFEREILKEFIMCENVDYQNDFHEYVIFKQDGVLVNLNEQDLAEIWAVLIEMYQIPMRQDEEIIASGKVKNLLKELEDFKKDCNRKNGVSLDSMLEAITVKHPSYNFINIWQLTIYQLFKTYKRIFIVDSFNEIMHWKYPGFIDVSKIDQNEIYWAKNI